MVQVLLSRKGEGGRRPGEAKPCFYNQPLIK
jgi:hypothetical protein